MKRKEEQNDGMNNNEWKSKVKVLFDEISSELKIMHQLIEPEVVSFMDNLDKMILFINLHVPKIEDGNNFGVEVQESIKTMISNGSASAYNFLREIPKYYEHRSKIETKLCKYPNLRDFYKGLIELDSKHALLLSHTIRDLRNNYFIIFDVIHKNYQKLIQPKGLKSVTMSLY